MKKFFSKRVCLLLFAMISGLTFLTASCFMQFANLPNILRLSPGQRVNLSVNFPLSFYIEKQLGSQLPLEVSKLKLFTNNLVLSSKNAQRFDIDLMIFGAIPLKRLHIEVAKPPIVIPGGEAIGVLLSSRGVVIVGHLSIKGVDQLQHYPAKDAGVKIGDILLAIDNSPINRVDEVEDQLRKYKQDQKFLKLTIKRQNKLIFLRIQPILSRNGGLDQRYMLGIYIEDPAAGVGTLTFYDPSTRRFAGLGHRISEFAGKQSIPLHQGEIVLAKINGIRLGIPGQPGEKIGMFNANVNPIGKVEKNGRFGIFGKLYGYCAGFGGEPIPIAYSSQIKAGPALIYTVINGTKVEQFKVEIIKVYRQDTPRDKGMVIKVTDPVLLKRTGGIIQGMSGSPIIQDGRLVGAVTHVLINDPTKGYGVLAEWMIKEMNQSFEAS